MITKNDCYLLLSELNEKGLDTSNAIKDLMSSSSPSLEVIKFINDNRQLDLTAFYEKLRKSYNNKKSKLYINIVKEIEQPQEVVVTLSSLLTQILLFSKDVEDKNMFLRHSRADEITKVLYAYFTNFDLTNCVKLIKLFKIDIKALESIH